MENFIFLSSDYINFTHKTSIHELIFRYFTFNPLGLFIERMVYRKKTINDNATDITLIIS